MLRPRVPEAAGMASEFNLHPAIAEILLRRGFDTSSKIQSFLHPSLEYLENPFAFSDMRKAVERIRAAIAAGEKILVYGDYDVDGVTASAILCPILKKMGADAQAYIPHRIDEGYGLNIESLARLLEKGFRLVITVDNGITGTDAIRFLQDQGVDVIVVDHHTPKHELPPAYAIVSACAGDKTGDPNLAACGLAFKLGWALSGSLEAVREYLDLVVLGTIADLAPLKGDNRILLKQGLPILAATRRPGLKALMRVARISKRYPTYRDIAFGLGPRINASGRMSSPEHAYQLLTTSDGSEAQRLAELLDEGNRRRQEVEAEAFQEASSHVDSMDPAGQNRILVVHSPDWHEGVLGIVAARLVERYKKPSIVISLKNGLGKGSGRSVSLFSLFDCVNRCEDLLETFGGHAQALGLSIREENLPLFRQRLNREALTMKALDAQPDLGIEAEIPLAELGVPLLRDLERLAPFGPGNPKPLFLSREVRVSGGVQKRGKDTLVCRVVDKSGKTTCEAVAFRAYQRWKNAGRQEELAIVYQPTLKDWNGIFSIELELADWI
ncbi:MAG: single-stranded-DNA-specific exonuclease RecJ [Candidatus Omnitrophica bacterium]|nr:single-stranded-DNA-specific exonuclease RecJ [Candidatus Omnitrophota bacterium]